ncbi:MAG: TlpA family protein disulfide reductase [Deltaproteobacteria bacterium]
MAGVFALAALLALSPLSSRAAGTEAEQRVLDYINKHIEPGKPLVVSELYSKVFTKPDERQALGKLYNSFFRIPHFVAEYQQKFHAPPTLAVIAEQFDLPSAQDAGVLVRVMVDDPRVPRFITRDAMTGEITKVDVEAIRADARFGRVVERHLGGWQGTPAPDFKLQEIGGDAVDLQSLKGHPVLLYVWFTGCPPCMKETPALVRNDLEYRRKGLITVGANADEMLGLAYDDEVRKKYMEEKHIAFPVVRWTKESDAAYGNISIFPTLFLIGPNGTIANHWVGYTNADEIARAISEQLAKGPGTSSPQN